MSSHWQSFKDGVVAGIAAAVGAGIIVAVAT